LAAIWRGRAQRRKFLLLQDSAKQEAAAVAIQKIFRKYLFKKHTPSLKSFADKFSTVEALHPER
jgi:hypothetical protein